MTRFRTYAPLLLGAALFLALFLLPKEGAVVFVEVSSGGFSPQTVSISQGDTVVFKNVDAESHWIASDIHPTHSAYPGSDIRKCSGLGVAQVFDSCRGIAAGETYRFRFNEAGEWGMHDHLYPALTGVVRVASSARGVEALFESLGASMRWLVEEPAYFITSLVPKDYEKADVASVLKDDREVRRMIESLGLPRTVDKVANEVIYEYAASECHMAMHVVGRQAYELMGAQAFGKCGAECFSGCYHGVMERMGAYGGTRIFDEIRSVCGARTTVFDRDQCFHGAGHGFLVNGRYDLMRAVAACQDLGEDSIRFWCYSGVFMEALEGDPQSKGAATFRSDTELHYPCSLFPDDRMATEACYRLWPSHFLQAYGNEYEKAAQECFRAPREARDECFFRLGQVAGAHTEAPAEKTETFCSTVPAEYFEACIRGGLRQAIVFPGPDPAGGPVSFCKTLAGGTAKEACYTEYARNLPEMFNDRETRVAVCALFEAPHDVSCRAAQ